MYVLKFTDQSARKKAILLKLKSNSMERLSDALKKFVEEKNGVVGLNPTEAKKGNGDI